MNGYVTKWAKGASMVVIEIGESPEELLVHEQTGDTLGEAVGTEKGTSGTAAEDTEQTRGEDGTGTGTQRTYGDESGKSDGTTVAPGASGGGGQATDGEKGPRRDSGQGTHEDGHGEDRHADRNPDQAADGIVEGGGSKDEGGVEKADGWVDNPNAERGYDGPGDPIPQDGGKVDGLAGGEPGSKHQGIPGALDWWGVIESPANIAAVIGLVGIVTDGDIAAVAQGLMKKARKVLAKKGGKGARKAIKELKSGIDKEVEDLVEQGMRGARKELKTKADWKYLDESVKASKLREAEETLRDHFQRRLGYHVDNIESESLKHADEIAEDSKALDGDEREVWDDIEGDLRDEAAEAGEVGKRLDEVRKEDASAAHGNSSYKEFDNAHGGGKPVTDAEAAKRWASTRKYWTESDTVDGMKVYQRSDLVDPGRVDLQGRTNLDRMNDGFAPVGPDGNSIELHHLKQANEGPVVEVTKTFHSANYDAIHINGNKMGSGIDRAAFDAWKANYWQHRARDFGG